MEPCVKKNVTHVCSYRNAEYCGTIVWYSSRCDMFWTLFEYNIYAGDLFAFL
jgi:hypothetical protein